MTLKRQSGAPLEGAQGRYLGSSTAALSAAGDAAVVWTQPNARGDVHVMLATRWADGATA